MIIYIPPGVPFFRGRKTDPPSSPRTHHSSNGLLKATPWPAGTWSGVSSFNYFQARSL